MNKNKPILFFYFIIVLIFIFTSLFIGDFVVNEINENICIEQFGPGDYVFYSKRMGMFKTEHTCRRLTETEYGPSINATYTYEKGF